MTIEPTFPPSFISSAPWHPSLRWHRWPRPRDTARSERDARHLGEPQRGACGIVRLWVFFWATSGCIPLKKMWPRSSESSNSAKFWTKTIGIVYYGTPPKDEGKVAIKSQRNRQALAVSQGRLWRWFNGWNNTDVSGMYSDCNIWWIHVNPHIR